VVVQVQGSVDPAVARRQAYEFIRLALATGALRFGEFTLKSGRISPYFFNMGAFSSGRELARIGRHYAHTLQRSGLEYHMLFGPAYKGIPLVAVTAVQLFEEYQRDVPFAYNRKEAKDHGEGGLMVGAAIQGRVVIVDDVLTAGTALRESVGLLRQAGAEPAGLVIAFDREERGQGERSAVQEIEAELGIPILRVLRYSDLLAYLREHPEVAAELGADLVALDQYRWEFGVE